MSCVSVYDVNLEAVLAPYAGLARLYDRALEGRKRVGLNHAADTPDPDYAGQHLYRANFAGFRVASPNRRGTSRAPPTPDAFMAFAARHVCARAPSVYWLPVWPDGLFYAASTWLSTAERGVRRGDDAARRKLAAAEAAWRELSGRGGKPDRRALATLPYDLVLRWLFAQPAWRAAPINTPSTSR